MDLKTESVDIDLLIPDPDNANTHDEKNLKAIRGSIKQFGVVEPLVVRRQNNVVIGGNGRLQVLKELGHATVPVHYVDFDDQKAKALALALNQSAKTSTFDTDILTKQLKALADMDFDIGEIGFDDFKFDIEPPTEGLTDPDEVPENVETRCKPGDLWILGNHRLLCGDSTNVQHVERLMAGEKADMVFTDPPYGVSLGDNKKFVDGELVTYKKKKIEGDESTEIYRLTVPIMAMCTDGPIYTWFADTKALDLYKTIDEIGGQCHALIIWHKTNAKYKSWGSCYKQRHEPCLFWKGKNGKLNWSGPSNEPTIWEEKRDYSQGKIHPTAKPVELAERAIKNHTAKTVLDIFLGSGSTLIAAEKTGRKCYGMEIDPHYCDVILERWEKYTGKQAVLEST